MSSKTKPETESLLRIPKTKPKLGLRVPQIPLPHDSLIRAEKPHLEIVPKTEEPTEPSQTTQPSNTRQTSVSSQSSQTRQTKQSAEIAPTKNFHKVTNSITRQAIPEGFFVGKSKQLYDVLYALTRGAIIPRRTVRISKTKLMKQAGIGSRITFDSCVERLSAVGLLQVKIYPGEHEGNEFEVRLPEEIETVSSRSSLTRQTGQTSHAQKLDKVVRPESSQSSQSLNDEDSDVYKDSKTFFKTSENVDDDFPLALLAQTFDKLSQKYTGKSLSNVDREKWRDLAELLGTEFEIAAARTKSVSNIPAFMTEHLRRRLFAKTEASAKTRGTARSLQIGKPEAAPDAEKPEPELLSEAEREAVLETLKGTRDWFFYQPDFAAEDWRWLEERLSSKENS